VLDGKVIVGVEEQAHRRDIAVGEHVEAPRPARVGLAVGGDGADEERATALEEGRDLRIEQRPRLLICV
jgi:hypothetical protein